MESLEPKQSEYVGHLLDMFINNDTRNKTPYRVKTAFRRVHGKESNGIIRKRFHNKIEERFREHGLTLDFLIPRKKKANA